MHARRLSFEDWLKSKGVVEKRENTQKIGGLNKQAGINYSFASEDAARDFAKAHTITAPSSRFQYQTEADTQERFPDPVSKKWSVYITETKHADLIAEYRKYLADLNTQRTSQDIQDQIAAITNRLNILENKKLRERLDRLSLLASNIKEGWDSQGATSAFDLSLRNYIALNMDLFSQEELRSLQSTADLIMGPDGDVTTGIKQDANWWDYTRRIPQQTYTTIITPVITDAMQLLDGEHNRRAIDEKTPNFIPMSVTGSGSDKEKRTIPRFFPNDKGVSYTDAIYLDSGGMSTHRTVTKIWKKGVNAQGNDLKPGQNPHHYEFYQTEYNAGAGLEWETEPNWNPETEQYKTGVAWVVSTKRIMPNWQFNQPLQQNQNHNLEGKVIKQMPTPTIDLAAYNKVMHDTIADLIIAQRMITLYQRAEKSNVTGDEQTVAKNQGDKEKWQEWRDKIDSHLGEQINGLSFRGVPQTSGNCSVMSVKVLTDDETHSLSEEHWRHAKQYNGDETVKALEAKKKLLETELVAAKKSEEVAKNLFTFIQEGNVDEVLKIIGENPGIVNVQESEHRATPLIAALYYLSRGQEQEPDKKLAIHAIVTHLLSRDQRYIHIQKDIQNSDQNTALHLAAYYAIRNDIRFIHIAAELIAKGARFDDDVKNKYGDTPLQHLIALPDDRRNALLLELLKERVPNVSLIVGKPDRVNQFRAALAIIKAKPESANITFDKHYGATPLSLAVVAGNTMAVDELLKLNANVTKRDKKNTSPLLWALLKISEELAKEQSQQDSEKITAYVDIACKLIDTNASMLGVGDNRNFTPLKWIESQDKNISALKKLFNKVNPIIEEKRRLEEEKQAAKRKAEAAEKQRIIEAIRQAEKVKKAGQPKTADEKNNNKYEILISKKTLENVKAYQKALIDGCAAPGKYLREKLKEKLKEKLPANIESLSTEQFLELLIQTKKPTIFAESAVVGGDGKKDWNQTELTILGDINFAVPVTVFDNGVWSGTGIKPHPIPFQGHLLFTPGALLKGAKGAKPTDSAVINPNGTINQEAYNALYEQRLLPLLMHANRVAGKDGAFITIPGIGCGAFAGDFKGQLGIHFEEALRHILEKHGPNLPNIRAIYFTPVDESNKSNQDNPTIIKGIDFRVRPQYINTGKSNPNIKPQLCHPVEYNESSKDHFDNCEFFSFVAWDHVSWPGNDFYGGSRWTDDGVKAAATDLMYQMTDVSGSYDTENQCYAPPQDVSNWKEVIEEQDKKLQVVGRVFVTDETGKKEQLSGKYSSQTYNSTQAIFSGLGLSNSGEKESEYSTPITPTPTTPIPKANVSDEAVERQLQQLLTVLTTLNDELNKIREVLSKLDETLNTSIDHKPPSIMGLTRY